MKFDKYLLYIKFTIFSYLFIFLRFINDLPYLIEAKTTLSFFPYISAFPTMIILSYLGVFLSIWATTNLNWLARLLLLVNLLIVGIYFTHSSNCILLAALIIALFPTTFLVKHSEIVFTSIIATFLVSYFCSGVWKAIELFALIFSSSSFAPNYLSLYSFEAGAPSNIFTKFIDSYPWLDFSLYILLTIIQISCVFCITFKKLRFYFGILLLSFHIGAYLLLKHFFIYNTFIISTLLIIPALLEFNPTLKGIFLPEKSVNT